MHCPYCGKDHPEDTRFCPETGKRLRKETTAPVPEQGARPVSKKSMLDLSSPGTLILLGVVVILVVLMGIVLTRQNRQAAIPLPTQDIPGTLAAIVNMTSIAQMTLPPPATATATLTIIPPTLTFTVAAPTAYILPTRTPMAGAYSACPNAYPSVLHLGDVAMVSTDPPIENNLRDKPSTESPITGTLEPGEEVNIVGGPECMNVYVWWKVTSRSSTRTGWTAEGNWNDYWLVKVQ
jgi:hypothetical protein